MHNSSLSLPHTEGGAAADRKFTLDESTDSDADVDEDDMFILKKGKEEFKPVTDNLGLFYKVRKLRIVFTFIAILIVILDY